jgi:hypothetical protein
MACKLTQKININNNAGERLMTDWSEIEGLVRRKRDKKKVQIEWKTKYQEARPRSAELIRYWDKLVQQNLSLIAEAAWGKGFRIAKTNERWEEVVDLFDIDRFVSGQLNMQEIGFRWVAYGPGVYFGVLVVFQDFSPTKIIVHGNTTLTARKANENELKKVLALIFEAGPSYI